MPSAERETVPHFTRPNEISDERASQVYRADRKMVRYRSRRPANTALRSRRRGLAAEQRRFDHRRLHVLLRDDDIVMNHKKTRRHYRKGGLSSDGGPAANAPLGLVHR